MSQALVLLYRGELIESVHRGHIAVADAGGKVLWQAEIQAA